MAELSDLLLELLNESNALDGAEERVEELEGEGEDHPAALVEALDKGVAGGALLPEDLVRWQGWIVGRSPLAAAPQSLHELCRRLNEDLRRTERPAPIAETARLIADAVYEFHSIHPFAEGNGRVARILAALIATACRVPVLIFRRSERAELARALESRLAMRVFVARKLREAIYDREGNVLLRAEAYGATDRYRSADGKSTVLMEWHELLDAVDAWRREA